MIPSQQLAAILGKFYASMRDLSVDDVAVVTQKRTLGRLDTTHEQELLDWFSIVTPLGAFATLVETPRNLKSILRRTKQMWSVLHGEIDFDDLLICNVIRFCAPDVFDFLLAEVSSIRRLSVPDRKGDLVEDSRLALRSHLEEMSKSGSWDFQAIQVLISFLFPNWTESRTAEKINVPQGVRVGEPTDYWQRLNVCGVDAQEVRDQAILGMLQEQALGNQLGQPDLAKLLYTDERYSRKFEQFCNYFFDGQQIRDVVAQVFRLVLKDRASQSSLGDLDRFGPLIDSCQKHPIGRLSHENWLYNEVFEALDISLLFANDLYYWFRSDSYSHVQVQGSSCNLRNRIVKAAREKYEKKPEAFAKVLPSKNVWASYHFSVLYSQKDQGGPGYVPEDWTWFSNLLLDAVEVDLGRVVPQLVGMLFTGQSAFEGGGVRQVYRIDEQCAKDLFADELHRAMEYIAKIGLSEEFEGEEKNVMFSAVRTANEWLKGETKEDNDVGS